MDYLIHLSILFCIYGILAISLNLVVGYTGLLSIAHAAFYGVGAYVTALLLTSSYPLLHSFFLSIWAGVIITALISLGISLVISRFKEDIYALVSLGLNVIVFSIFLNWQEVTRGPLGISGISRPSIAVDNFSFMILAMVMLAIVYLLSYFIVSSSFGRVLRAIREDEQAIQVFGYNTRWYKLIVFVISACMASVAGSLYASYITFIDPSTFTIHESIFVLTIIILGGLASLRGSVLGTLVLILLPEILRFVGMPDDIAAQMRQLIYGMILVLLMLYRPQGLMGEYKM